MLNIAMTPTAEALLQQLIDAGVGEPASIIEQALQYLCDRQLTASDIDTTDGFSTLTEAEILQENEQRWKTFEQQGGGRSQAEVATRFELLITPTDA